MVEGEVHYVTHVQCELCLGIVVSWVDIYPSTTNPAY